MRPQGTVIISQYLIRTRNSGNTTLISVFRFLPVCRWTPLGSLFAVGPPWDPCSFKGALRAGDTRSQRGTLLRQGFPLRPLGYAGQVEGQARNVERGTRNRRSGRRPETPQPRPTAWVGESNQSIILFSSPSPETERPVGRAEQERQVVSPSRRDPFGATGLTSLSPSPPLA